MDGILFRNGECDNDCNLLKCRWDGGDCDDTPVMGDGQREAYRGVTHQSETFGF